MRQLTLLVLVIGFLVGCQTPKGEGEQTIFTELKGAKHLGERVHLDPSTNGWTESVYQTPDGRYIMYVESGPQSKFYGDTFTEWLPEKRAEKWLKNYGNMAPTGP
ncbi:MAG: hypothetical protein ABFS45_03025 [Pseudomonadota bacterium]